MARYGAPGAVLVIDLDNFKDVNDTFGHKAGDDLLKGVAGAVRHRIRQTDLLARIGGDEFAVLLPQADADQAQVVADAIVKALGRHVAVLGDRSIRVTASVGVAMFDGLSGPRCWPTPTSPCTRPRRRGGIASRSTTPAGDGRERGVGAACRGGASPHALEEDRLVLYGQPILDLRHERDPPVRAPAAAPRTRRAASRSRPAPFSTSPSASA